MALIENFHIKELHIHYNDDVLKSVLEQLLLTNKKLDLVMAAKDEIQSAVADIKSAAENIAADLERIADNAEGGLTKTEADAVAADLRSTATRLKAIADINPEPATPPVEPPAEGTGS